MLAGTLHGAAQATAQPETYKFDLGAGIGMSGYLGDANESSLFSHPGLAADISMRYLLNTRFALRAIAGLASLSGSTADMDNVLPDGAVYDFRSSLYDLQVRGEFNFFSYGIGESYKKLSRITPYLALGLGVSMASCEGKNFTAMTKVLGDHADGPDLSDLYLIKSSFIKNTDWYSTLRLSLTYEFGERCVECHRLD